MLSFTDSIGQQRGAVATSYLLEMNNEVRGDFVEDSAEHILSDRPEFFRTFSLVVASAGGMSEKALRDLSKVLWEAGVPLVVVRAYGFIGYIRLQVSWVSLTELK